jgi:hypothetical protein
MINANDYKNAKQYLERFIRTFQNEIKRASNRLNTWYHSGKEGTNRAEDI